MMQFSRSKLLRFFDQRDTKGVTGADVSAITGLLGEDIVIGAFLHFWVGYHLAGSAHIADYTPVSVYDKKKLDAWIEVSTGNEKFLFQAEVKNWSTHSYGGYPSLPIDADKMARRGIAVRNWKRWLNDNVQLEKIRKVMSEMRPPRGLESLERKPLLCFWAPLTTINEGESEHFFRCEENEHCLSGAWIFSASSYLRSITHENIELEVPRYDARLSILKNLSTSH